MPKLSSHNDTSTKRKSGRTPKSVKKKVYVEDHDDDLRMPEGYNPSDDSEEEYVPPSKSKKPKVSVSRTKRIRHEGDSDVDSEDDEEIVKQPMKKMPKKNIGLAKDKESKSGKKTSQPNTKSNSNVQESKAGKKPTESRKVAEPPAPILDSNTIICPKCAGPKKDKIKLDGNAKFHISMHYYDTNSYFNLDILKPSDPDENGRAKDEKGSSIRYSCQYAGCTKRKMGYKEMCVHLGTQHNLLKHLMSEDSDPEVQKAMLRIYPELTDAQLKVKTEVNEVLSREPLEHDNSENVDDPDDPPAAAPAKPKASNVLKPIVTNTGKVFSRPIMETPIRPKVDKVMNCILCSNKDGRNLDAGKSELRYHMSVCAYGTGGFLRYIDPHQDASQFGQGQDKFEEFGKKYKYKCQFEGCDKASAKAKPVGYKELAIHAGVMHGILERWAADEQERPGAKELYETLKGVREADGNELPAIPDTIVERVHTCLICQGSDKDGLNLSFKKEKLYQTRYHYASCLYDSGNFILHLLLTIVQPS